MVYLPEWLASFAERTGPPPARGAPGAGWGVELTYITAFFRTSGLAQDIR